MIRLIGFLATIIVSTQVVAECPSYLDQPLRKLHSKVHINLCEMSANQPLLLVNTASHCGFTPQFKGLEALYQKYKTQGLVVVGFASNDFNQEAGDEKKAAKICYVNNGVTFTMLAPTHVKGDQANAVFRELAAQTAAPDWNFNKYLVSRSGKVVNRFGSRTEPSSSEFQKAIEKLL